MKTRYLGCAVALFGITSTALAEDPIHAIAVVGPVGTSAVSGVLHFETTPAGLHITGDVKGLRPQGNHGFHVHEFGDCSAADGTSAGGHFKLPNTTHGGPTTGMRHLGDLGNLASDEAGTAKYDHTDTNLALTGPNSIVGRSLVIHGGEDDMKTDPAGNSGPRIACGVVGLAK